MSVGWCVCWLASTQLSKSSKHVTILSKLNYIPACRSRGVPNSNNLAESEFIRKRIVPFLINRIENMNIRIRLLINRIGVCSIPVIPVRNRMQSVNIPYEPNISKGQKTCGTMI